MLLLLPMAVSADCDCDLQNRTVKEDSDDKIFYHDLEDDCDSDDLELFDYETSHYTLDYTDAGNLRISNLEEDYYDSGYPVRMSCGGNVFNFTLAVEEVNDDPSFYGLSLNTVEGEPFEQGVSLVNKTEDVDDSDFSYSLLSEGEVGCTIYSGKLNTSYPSGWTGHDECRIEVRDGRGGKTNGTVNLTVVDETPPLIFYEINSITGEDWAKISWVTDENTSSRVMYGESPGSYQYTESSSEMVKEHDVELSLEHNTTYYFVVESEDEFGNTNRSEEHSLKTVPDRGPPSISLLSDSAVEKKDFTVRVRTSEESECRYSEEDIVFEEKTSLASEDGLEHSFDVSGKDNGDHGFYVSCVDDADNMETERFVIDVEREIIESASFGDSDDKMLSGSEGPNKITLQTGSKDKGDRVKWYLKDESFSLDRIGFKARKEFDELSAEITRFTHEPVEKFRLDKGVYQYMGIKVDDSMMYDISAGFTVDPNWLDVHDIEPYQVRLYRYDEGWQELDTSAISNESYEADVPGFSLFAVSFNSSAEEPVEPEEEEDEVEKGIDNVTVNKTEAHQANVSEDNLSVNETSNETSPAGTTGYGENDTVDSNISLEGEEKNASVEKPLPVDFQEISYMLLILLFLMPLVIYYLLYFHSHNLKPHDHRKEKGSAVEQKEGNADVKEDSGNTDEGNMEEAYSKLLDMKEDIDESLEKTKFTENRKPNNIGEVESLMMRRIVANSLKNSVPEKRIKNALINKGYGKKEVEETIRSVRRCLSLNSRLKNVSDRLWKMYHRKV
ncbi:MAG: PGF-pre-PGF domain-containing protein [Nanobdellota archaeon]